ncbi:CPBP family intramembrane glutamic endopeptidase [Shimia abyssi]|uniref:CAAX prenyl protease-like protein n=1 Tax=Shimia abyssi TaxID=1662395 RepID=A0A2P8FFI3_9RHOB|nr:CPBP family intramembrane glutamic endopeptidase [Shimia abyssi]PSL20477.1 CAAX prenyl protease-like protein [Shimia abyssi]
MTHLPFLMLTFGISLTGFVCILFFPAARSPETAAGLPVWLVMVWGPSLAAIVLSLRDGQLVDLLIRVVRVSTVPPAAWFLVLAPILLLAILRPFAPEETQPLETGLLVSMIAFNLILGPLGEELGWRGFFQDRLNREIGWLEASLLIGAIWFVWHLPLWMIESPHSEIAISLFAGHVICYSIVIGGAYTISGGSILPAVLIHLTFNLASNFALFAGFRDPNAWFSASLGPYCVLSVIAIGLVYERTGKLGLSLFDT